jgi:two-component system NtrC family sensor kinase
MSKVSSNDKIYKTLFHLRLLPVLALTTFFDLNQVTIAREINAAVVNVSGRQRMLSQRTALFALRLVCTQDAAEQEKCRQELLAAINLMEKSHNGLIYGDLEMKLPGNPSPVVKAMYFEPPIHLDLQVRNYIFEAKALAAATDLELTQDNLHLCYILTASAKDLLEALDAVVTQYQQESDDEQQAIDLNLSELYHQSCTATATAQAQAQQVQQAMRHLQQTQAQLIQSEKMSSIGQLVAGVAHEINNPINFIYGNLDHADYYTQDLLELVSLYQEYYPDPVPQIQERIKALDLDFLIEDLPKMLSSMKMGAERISQIVLSLRNFSRVDEAEMKLVNIHDGLDSTLLILQNRLKPKARNRIIEIIKEYGNLPLVECYAGQLNQVFMNILTNAIDAFEEVPNRPAQIIIRTEVSHSDSVTIRISDNGVGIIDEVKAQLFDPFFTTKPVGKGTGLGLSISYQIVVKKHGGVIKCESTPGEGTEFWIHLPVRQLACQISPVSGALS